MTRLDALRYVGHHWTAWGLRIAVLYIDVLERALRRIPIRTDRNMT
jgi:hypothetical protein